MLQDGEDIIKSGKTKYDSVQINENQMYIMLLHQELQMNLKQLCYRKQIFAKMYQHINIILKCIHQTHCFRSCQYIIHLKAA